MIKNFYQKLTFKHTLITVSVVFITGLFISILQVSYDLSLNKERVSENIERLVNITEDSAAQSLYHLDKAQAEKLINGYIKYSPVINVSITDNFGINLSSKTVKHDEKSNLMSYFFPNQTENFSYNLEYITEDLQTVAVGTLEIQVDYSVLFSMFLKKAKTTFLFDILMSIIIAAVLALLFYKTLTKPLVKISDDISGIDPSSPEGQKLTIPAKNNYDELGNLVKSINLILHEYSKLNTDLEKRVMARTKELYNTNKKLKKSLFQLEKAKDRLVHSEKMASLGGLVAGVSHEINTPVGNSVTAASFLQNKLDDISKKFRLGKMNDNDIRNFLSAAAEASDIILKNLERSAALIVSFKQVAVDQTYSSMRIFGLKKHIQDTIISLKPKFKGTNITINLKCNDDLYIFQDPGVFSQIITNLVLNSFVHGFKKDQIKIIDVDILKSSGFITIHYRDNGKGIDKEAGKKIFEPFFTTNKSKGGSGLGMYIIYNLITSKLSGEIKILSRKNRTGAYFYIKFPVPEE
ncbi:MAG: HAMP domain-containing sensor histidine kinase [Candidatus Muiribacteriota bacterium]